MWKQIFAGFSDSHLAVLGFLIFLTVFVITLIWTLFVQRKSFYDELSLQPLQKGSEYE